VTRVDSVPLLTIDSLTVAFDGVPALRGIDLSIAHGEAFGLVGESGCGKSVTLLAALGLLPASAHVAGSVRLDGAELLGASPATLDTVRGGRVAMIFQDPASALNPVHRVGTQVTEALRLHRGLDGSGARAEARRLFDLVGIPDPVRRLDAYPHELSGGQNQRVMIAMALAGQPELLIADEPTTALDATIQAQILDLLRRLQLETGMALILISHDLGVIADLCSKVAVMYAGRIVEQATTEALFAHPAHPYTRGLLGALPDMDGPRRRLTAIEGSVPEPWSMPPGCAFAPRCPMALQECDREAPLLRPLTVHDTGNGGANSTRRTHSAESTRGEWSAQASHRVACIRAEAPRRQPATPAAPAAVP
jgi:peptide/nickel transport system ATP-binding protein